MTWASAGAGASATVASPEAANASACKVQSFIAAVRPQAKEVMARAECFKSGVDVLVINPVALQC
jgi:hypothetical protein